jgi:hypothetical protein
MVTGNIILVMANYPTTQSSKKENEKENGNTSIQNKNPTNAGTIKTIKKKACGELGMNREC